MLQHLRQFFFVSILFCFALAITDSGWGEENSCWKCHKKEHSAEENTIHLQEGVSCAGCHGGDPAQKEKATSHRGFTGKISKLEVPQLCAKCHSDVRKMNPYGISTDQYSQYLTSKHGEALMAGKTDVATCADCHQWHGIRKVRDPESPVYPKNVPSTCGHCHSDQELMARHDIPATAENLYRQSIHAELLLKKDDLSAPTCVTCHGNHGAVPPGFSQISHVCGKCHIKQQELFAESPHAPYAEEGDFQGCVTCHRNHKILRSRTEIFKQCLDCHDEKDEAMQKRNAMFASIQGAETNFEKTKERLASVARAGHHTEDEELLLEEAKTNVLQLLPVQHTLNIDNVKKMAASAETVLADINERLDKKEKTELIKRFALIPIWLFLIAMAFVFWAKRKEIEKTWKKVDWPGI